MKTFKSGNTQYLYIGVMTFTLLGCLHM